MFRIIRVSTLTAILLMVAFSVAVAGEGDTPPYIPSSYSPETVLLGKKTWPGIISVSITNVSSLEPVVFYGPGAGNAGCEAEDLSIRANISHPTGIADAYIRYRYLGNSGYVGSWQTVPVHDYAMGGLHGFIIDVSSEAGIELGTDDGTVEYQVHAESVSGVLGYYPDGYVLGVPVEYCP